MFSSRQKVTEHQYFDRKMETLVDIFSVTSTWTPFHKSKIKSCVIIVYIDHSDDKL